MPFFLTVDSGGIDANLVRIVRRDPGRMTPVAFIPRMADHHSPSSRAAMSRSHYNGVLIRF